MSAPRCKTDVQNFYRQILHITANCILRFLGFFNYSPPTNRFAFYFPQFLFLQVAPNFSVKRS